MGCITSRKDWRPAGPCLQQESNRVPRWHRGHTRMPVELAIFFHRSDRLIVRSDRWRKWVPLLDDREIDQLRSLRIDIDEGW